MLTEDQFKDLLKMLEMREMLIRIDENTKNFHINIDRRLDEHIAKDSEDHGIQTKAVDRAHGRVDELKIDITSIQKDHSKLRGFIVGVNSLTVILVACFQLYLSFVNTENNRRYSVRQETSQK